MLKKIVIGLIVLGAVLTVVIIRQPDQFRVSRSLTIAAPAAAVFPHINSLRAYQEWSPWTNLDPNIKIVMEGPAAGPGALMKWSGNRQVGEGVMTLTESQSPHLVRFNLAFLKPFKSTSSVEFTLLPEGKQTLVTWTMHGANNFISKAMTLVMDCDKMIGGDFEKGLAQLKTITEQRS